MASSVARKQEAVVIGAAMLWLALVGFGMSVLWSYSTTPGRAGTPPRNWPASASVSRHSGRATLLIFTHPECECSRASLSELAILMAHSGSLLDATVFFSLPARQATLWKTSELFSKARAIPGVRVVDDPESKLAQLFGAHTSGETLLYDGSGRLRFHGGITAFRGHSGDNAGRSVITAILWNKIPQAKASPATTPVFGCSLRDE